MNISACPEVAAFRKNTISMSKHMWVALVAVVKVFTIITIFLNAFLTGGFAHENRKYSTIFQAIKSDDLQAVKDFVRKDPEAANMKLEIEMTAPGFSLRYILSPFLYACMFDKPQTVNFFLSKGADVNAMKNMHPLPLDLASKQGHKGMAGLLISHGADVNGRGPGYWTPLHYTCIYGYKEISEVSVPRGASKVNKYGETPLFYALIEATQKTLKGRQEVVGLLIANGADVNVKNNFGYTPLHLAAGSDQREAAELLIAKGSDVNAKNNFGGTPLSLAGTKEMYAILRRHAVKLENKPVEIPADSIDSFFRAIEAGDVNLVKRMLECTPELVNTMARYRQIDMITGANGFSFITPLYIAIENRNTSMIEILISKGADVNAKGTYGETPLRWALEKCMTTKGEDETDDLLKSRREAYRRIALFLVSKGADVTTETCGRTPLHYIVQLRDNNKESAELLISKGADVNAKDTCGETPLHGAANKEIAEFLVSKGADVNAKDTCGETPLHRAANKEIAEFLVSKGAHVNAKDNYGGTPLHEAANAEIARFFVSIGGDVNAKNNKGDTPLHRAANKEIAEFLVSKGAHVNGKDNLGNTPLHDAASNSASKDQIAKARFLILNGADVNAKDNKGNTPLHEAVAHNFGMDQQIIQIIELLIIKGADINRRNYAGKTPLQVAKKEGSIEIVDLLRGLGARE